MACCAMSGIPAFTKSVDCDEDDATEENGPERAREAGAGKQRLKRGQKQGSSDYAEIMSTSPGDQRAADDHDGDRWQHIVVAHPKARLP